MHFSQLRLQGFRNYTQLEVAFCPEVNFLTGNNGAGKTNVLEAIQYLCMTRGWIAKSEKYALKEGEPYFSIAGTLETVERQVTVQCNYLPAKGKKVIVDRKPVDRMSDHIGMIPIVTVLPNDTQLIHGNPAHRRKFMDGFICQYSPAYLRALLMYENALEQRNALLNLMHERRTWDPEQLEMWDAQLTTHGMLIAEGRRAFLEKYVPAFLKYFRLIVSDAETPELSLLTTFHENEPESWSRQLGAAKTHDRYALKTTVGIHKDDLEFKISGQPVRNYGSQGQQKTFLIALKLAQYEVLAEESGKKPLLLLDDIFDKLDQHRLEAIAGILDMEVGGQVFITDTSAPRMQQLAKRFAHRATAHYQVEAASLNPLTRLSHEQ